MQELDLVAAQCNGIAPCAYSLKIFTVLYLHYCIYSAVQYMVCSIKISFYLCFWTNGSLMILFRVDCRKDLFSLSFENGLIYPVWFDRACYARVDLLFDLVL